MDKTKERYEFIVGYVALIIALSSFKEELKKIIIDIGLVKFDLSQYLFIVICGFFICILFYIIPYIFSSTNFSHWRIFRIIEYISYFMFIIIALSPLLIFSIWIIKFAIDELSSAYPDKQDSAIRVIAIFLSILSGMLSVFIVTKYRIEKLLKIKNQIEEKEIRELEIAEKLYKDNYFSQAILEAFKVLESHIYKLLISKDIKINRGRFTEMFNLAYRYKLISKDDLLKMLEIRSVRNNVAHLSNTEYKEEEAKQIISYIKDLIKKNSNDTK